MTVRASIAITAGAAALFTLLVSVTSLIHFAYRNPALHVAVETSAALISIVAAQLIYGRFRQSYELGDLLLTASLSIFAVANLLSTIPELTGAERGSLRDLDLGAGTAARSGADGALRGGSEIAACTARVVRRVGCWPRAR